MQPTPALTFRTIGGLLDLYFFLGPEPMSVVEQYTDIIGKPFLVPFWSLGYHQVCRLTFDSVVSKLVKSRTIFCDHNILLNSASGPFGWLYGPNQIGDDEHETLLQFIFDKLITFIPSVDSATKTSPKLALSWSGLLRPASPWTCSGTTSTT